MIKRAALVLVVVLVVAAYAFNAKTKVDVSCGPMVTTPLVVQVDRASRSAGDIMRDFAESDRGTLDVVEMTTGMWKTVGMWIDSWSRGLNGEAPSKDSKAYERATREAQRKAVQSCCPAAPVDPTPPDGEAPPNDGGGTPPFDPRTLSFNPVAAGRQVDAQQQENIAAVAVAVADSMGMSDQAKRSIVATGFVESEVQNLSYGDRDSVGWLQQRTSQGWGTISQLMQPAYGAKKFFQRYREVDGDSMSPGRAAQAVQVSEFPDRYAERLDDADRLLAKVGELPPLVGDPVDPAQPAYCNPATAEKNAGGGASIISPTLAAFTTSVTEARIGNPRSPQQALAWLKTQHQNTSGGCLHYVAAAYGFNSTKPHPAPIDGGQWGADEQWRLIPAKYKHSPAEPAPPGAVMWWDGGNVDGHVALSLGDGMVRSTGVAAGSGVGDKPLDYFKGYGDYVGWSLPYWPDRSKLVLAA